MRARKIIYMPVKDGGYVLDSREKPRVYVSLEALAKASKRFEYDTVLVYENTEGHSVETLLRGEGNGKENNNK